MNPLAEGCPDSVLRSAARQQGLSLIQTLAFNKNLISHAEEALMSPDTNRNDASFWESLYEKAVAESDRALRTQRLLEAEEAILQRARALDEEQGDHEGEALALEEAARFIREMKQKVKTNGEADAIKPGDQEELPKRRLA